MNDIAERLHEFNRIGNFSPEDKISPLLTEAADEIERLRLEARVWKDKFEILKTDYDEDIEKMASQADSDANEIGRLNSELEKGAQRLSDYRASFEKTAIENGKLRDSHAFQVDANRSLMEAIGKSQDEVGRLRTALQQIIGLTAKDGSEVARRALQAFEIEDPATTGGRSCRDIPSISPAPSAKAKDDSTT